MRAVAFTGAGGNEVVEVVERPDPAVGPEDVLVEVTVAGMNPAGVICEVMNDDGTMARLPDLVKFAQLHGLKVATITDLIAYRRRTEKVVERVLESRINSRFGGEFKVIVYANKVAYAEHIALVKGDVSGEEPVLVRMHQVNLLADALGDMTVGQFFQGESRARGSELVHNHATEIPGGAACESFKHGRIEAAMAPRLRIEDAPAADRPHWRIGAEQVTLAGARA